MFNQIIQFSLKHRLSIIIGYIFICIAGVRALQSIPVDVLPDLNRPRVTVFASAEGLGAQETEQIVAMPLERIFATIPGVQAVRSSSALELSVINVEFDRGTDINIARQQVNERIQSTSLPDGVHTSMAPQTALLGEVLWIGLTSTGDTTQAQMRGIAEGSIRQTLTSVPGIANLLIMGGTPQQYNILIDPAKMISQHISLEDVQKSLDNITTPAGGGVVLQPTSEYPVSLIPVSGDIKLLGSLIIGINPSGNKIQLSDIAKVTEGSNNQRRGDALIDGQEGVIVRISKVPNANTLTLTDDITTSLDTIQESLPVGVTLHKSLFKQADFINKGLNNIKASLKEAIIIVAIIVIFFLMSLRASFIPIISLPVTLLLTAIVFKLLGFQINIMVLGGLTIAIGELVDDAIVDMENIYRRLRENYLQPKHLQKSRASVIYHASLEVRGSVVYATILQVIVFIPFLILPGIDGKLLAPIGIAYIIANLMSLLTAITFVPVICSYIFPNWISKIYAQKYPELYTKDSIADPKKIALIIQKEEDTRLTKRLKAIMIKPIKRSLKNPRKALFLALATLPITIGLYLTAQKEGLPSFNETSYTIGVTTKPGSSLDYTMNIAKQFVIELNTIEGIKSTATILGRADADAHAQGSNSSETEVDLGIEITNKNKKVIFDQINEVIKKYKQYAIISIGQPITHRVEELISGIRAPLVIKIYGTDLDKIEDLGKEVLKRIETVPGVLNPSLEPQTKVPSINVSPNIANQALYGVPYNEVKEILEIGIGGREVSQVIDGQLRYPVVMKYDTPRRGSVEALSSIPLSTTAGQQLNLGTLATITTSKARNMINHENGQRRIVIQGFTQGRGIVDVVDEIKTKLTDLKLPQGYRISYEGLYQAQAESTRLLTIVGIFVVLALIFVLYMHFGSIKITGQIMLDILTGWLGGMIGVRISGGLLSTAHLVGFIALMGIVARNGILLIDHYKHLHEVENIPRGEDLIIKGSLERIVPVFMTATSATLGLLPLVLSAGDTGNEILAPISIVLFYGLLVSTLIEFLIRPGIFYHYNKGIYDKKETKNELQFDE